MVKCRIPARILGLLTALLLVSTAACEAPVEPEGETLPRLWPQYPYLGLVTPGREPAEPVDPPRLQNEMTDPGLIQFQNTVNRQVQQFPEHFFLAAVTSERVVALTFDDGPHGTYTPQLLDILQQHGLPATFFVLGSNAARYPGLISRMVEEGHAVGTHSQTHPDLRNFSPQDAYASQLRPAQDAVEEITGFRPGFFRPPYGAVTDEQIVYFADRGLKTTNWSVDSFDWDARHNAPQEIASRVFAYLHPGAIILFHDNGPTVAALPNIIAGLQDRGYTFVTVPDLLDGVEAVKRR